MGLNPPVAFQEWTTFRTKGYHGGKKGGKGEKEEEEEEEEVVVERKGMVEVNGIVFPMIHAILPLWVSQVHHLPTQKLLYIISGAGTSSDGQSFIFEI